MESVNLPAIPPMPILEETPDEIYQRWVNKAKELANARGETPPETDEGEYFYDLWYPIAQEVAEQQSLLSYALVQGFPIWADGEYLNAHGWGYGVIKKDAEDDEALRWRILDNAFLDEGNGRRQDYEVWAKEIPGVGNAIGIEKERHDVSIDLYITDMQGQPATMDFATEVQQIMWEKYRIAGHDLQVHPAPIFQLTVEAAIEITNSDLQYIADMIKKKIYDYAKNRSKLVFNHIAALLFVDGVENYNNLSLNGALNDVEIPFKSVLQVELVLS